LSIGKPWDPHDEAQKISGMNDLQIVTAQEELPKRHSIPLFEEAHPGRSTHPTTAAAPTVFTSNKVGIEKFKSTPSARSVATYHLCEKVQSHRSTSMLLGLGATLSYVIVTGDLHIQQQNSRLMARFRFTESHRSVQILSLNGRLCQGPNADVLFGALKV